MFDDRVGKELLLGSPDVAPDAGAAWATHGSKEIAAAALATLSALTIIGTFVGYAASFYDAVEALVWAIGALCLCALISMLAHPRFLRLGLLLWLHLHRGLLDEERSFLAPWFLLTHSLRPLYVLVVLLLQSRRLH